MKQDLRSNRIAQTKICTCELEQGEEKGKDIPKSKGFGGNERWK